MYRTSGQHIHLESNTDNKQSPIKHSCCVSLWRDAHWKSLILTLLILGCLGATAWCRLAIITSVVVYYERHTTYQDIKRSSPCADGYIYIPIAFVILLYLVYLVECWHCHTRIELQNKVDVQTVYHKMRQMREALPIIWWKALCFHFVRRTRHVTRYRNGDAFTSTQVYYERVNSHTAGCAFNFTNCGFKDDTKYVTGLEDYPATKIRFSKSYSFIHADAKLEFDEQRNQFFTANERRDEYMETREGMDLLNVNFKEYMMAFKDPDHLPWYISNSVFWIASFLLLSWPLRVIIEFKTAYIHYHVHKIFGTNYVGIEHPSGATVVRTNTIESAELDMIIRNNFTIVPSYSEALMLATDTAQSRQVHVSDDANESSPILGPVRSFTSNTIANIGSSSGYITRFFSSSTIPKIIHSSTLPNFENVDILSPVSTDRTLRSSLRNMLRSPWLRRKQKNEQPQPCNRRSNTMFMLSSPESLDGYSVDMGQRIQSAHLTRNYSSCSDVNDERRANESVFKNDDPRNTFRKATNCTNVRTGETSKKTAHRSLSRQALSTTKSDEDKINDVDHKPQRPCYFASSRNSFVTDKNAKSKISEHMFVKCNLPKVPVNNVLPESCSDNDGMTPTPLSPPSYEQALHMHKHLHQENIGTNTESRDLLNSNQTSCSHFSAIMETSL